MLARLLPFLKDIVGRLWDHRFQESLIAAKAHGDPESYRKGYSKGYWDGIADLASVLAQQETLAENNQATPLAHPLLKGRPIAEA